MTKPLPIRVPDLKKLVRATQDMGLPVTGIMIGRDGSIHIQTREIAEGAADSALDDWLKKNG